MKTWISSPLISEPTGCITWRGLGFYSFPHSSCGYVYTSSCFFFQEALSYISFVAAALENGNICFIITTWEPLADSWQKAGSLLRKAQQLNNALAPFLLLKPSSLVRELRDSLWLSIPQTSTAPCSYKKCSELSHCTKNNVSVSASSCQIHLARWTVFVL